LASDFSGKVVWITGGGSGLGRAMALEFASRGSKLAVSGRRLERLEETVEALKAKGVEALAVQCDVTDEQSQAAAVKAVVDRFGRLDVVVANAGFAVDGRFRKISVDQWRRQFETNVVGTAITVQQALPELEKTKGRIALISSVASMISYPRGSAYGSSKAAVRSLGLCLSQELHGTGVSCTTIHPGFVESEIGQVSNDGVYDGGRKDMRPAKLLWKTEPAAKRMVGAIERRKIEYVFTGHGHLIAFMGRHFPGLVHLLVTRFARNL
jgi:NAD(P)-dependent dehydrogenase (short-subunit alcohol dehydrogenase family)